MLMQIVAWILAAPAIILILAYAMIFTSLLAAKLRQAHPGFVPHHAAAGAIRDLRHAPDATMDSLPR
jgi:hypothetical protein